AFAVFAFGLLVGLVGKLDLLDVDAAIPSRTLGDEPDFLDLRLRRRDELPEPAREARPEAGQLDHRNPRLVAELRSAALVREALLAPEVRTAFGQVVDVGLTAAAHVEDDRVVVDDLGAVDARADDAVLRSAVQVVLNTLCPVLSQDMGRPQGRGGDRG